MLTKQFTIRALLLVFVLLSLALAADVAATSKLHEVLSKIESNPTNYFENEETVWSNGGIAVWHNASEILETTSFYDRILLRRSITLKDERTILQSKESAFTSSFNSEINLGLFISHKVESTLLAESVRFNTGGFGEIPDGAFARDESELTPTERANQPSVQPAW